jgi:hypothetical protein
MKELIKAPLKTDFMLELILPDNAGTHRFNLDVDIKGLHVRQSSVN